MPPHKAYIDWTNSEPRELLLADLRANVLPLDDAECSADAAWQAVYKDMAAFKHVPFKQFEEKLAHHREQVRKDDSGVTLACAAYQNDRKYYNRSYTSDGRRIFRLSPAQKLLEDDIAKNMHVGRTPAEFHQTRAEYLAFPLAEFRPRIYQEQRLVKCHNWMEAKHNKKAEKMQKKWKKQRELLDGEELKKDTHDDDNDDDDDNLASLKSGTSDKDKRVAYETDEEPVQTRTGRTVTAPRRLIEEEDTMDTT